MTTANLRRWRRIGDIASWAAALTMILIGGVLMMAGALLGGLR